MHSSCPEWLNIQIPTWSPLVSRTNGSDNRFAFCSMRNENPEPSSTTKPEARWWDIVKDPLINPEYQSITTNQLNQPTKRYLIYNLTI